METKYDIFSKFNGTLIFLQWFLNFQLALSEYEIPRLSVSFFEVYHTISVDEVTGGKKQFDKVSTDVSRAIIQNWKNKLYY